MFARQFFTLQEVRGWVGPVAINIRGEGVDGIEMF